MAIPFKSVTASNRETCLTAYGSLFARNTLKPCSKPISTMQLNHFEHQIEMEGESNLVAMPMHLDKTKNVNPVNSFVYIKLLTAGKPISLILEKENGQWYAVNDQKTLITSNRPFVITHDEMNDTLSLRVNMTAHYLLALNENKVKQQLSLYKARNSLLIKDSLSPKQCVELLTDQSVDIDKVVAAGELYFNNEGQLLAIGLKSGCFHIENEDELKRCQTSIDKAIKSFPLFKDTKILYTFEECITFEKSSVKEEVAQESTMNSLRKN